jgi:hypothetical protein
MMALAILYDCMDAWQEYGDIAPEVIAREPALVDAADGVIVSSGALFETWGGPPA